MDGVSVTEAPRLKRGSVRYASAPSTARTGDIDYDASLNILRGSGWEPPLEPVELRPLPAGQRARRGLEAGSPVREGGAVHIRERMLNGA